MHSGKKSLARDIIFEGKIFTVAGETTMQVYYGALSDGKTQMAQLKAERLIRHGKN